MVLTLLVVFRDQQVSPLCIMHAAVSDHVQKRFRLFHDCVRGLLRQLLRRHTRTQPRHSFFLDDWRPRRLHDRRDQLFRRVRFRSQGVGQTHAERALQPRQQLHALQASQSQIAVQI